jgi:hypothetical protein
MRIGFLILGVFACVGLFGGWMAQSYQEATEAGLTDDARLAVKLRCEGQRPGPERECRAMLSKLYRSGALDPDKTLRTYCDSVKNGRWGSSRPAPPRVCVERYGGWQAS